MQLGFLNSFYGSYLLIVLVLVLLLLAFCGESKLFMCFYLTMVNANIFLHCIVFSCTVCAVKKAAKGHDWKKCMRLQSSFLVCLEEDNSKKKSKWNEE